MRVRNAVIAAAVAATIGFTQSADAKEFRWAFQGDAQSLDPYSLNETFTLGFLGNVYEGLTQRGPDLQIMPALAESWEIVEPTRWRFKLRKGVKFHNGNDFTADDVVFSFNRVQAEGSDLQTRIPGGTSIEKVDDYTVDIITDGPNPILINDWDSFYIMDKEWSEANDAVAPTSVTEGKENYAAFNANGTGPFKIESRERDVRTVFVPNEDYWGDVDHNVTKGIFTPISSDATRVAALLSGEIDMMYPVPVQDMQRINNNSGTSVLSGPELRTIFLGFDQSRDELLYSNVEGENPFKDVRVRKAFYHAIDIQAIKDKVMRGLSTPSALMISPFLFARSDEFERFPYDPEQAKDRRRTSSPRPAMATGSASAWTAPTTATSTTKRSARRWSPCWRASVWTWICWRSPRRSTLPRCWVRSTTCRSTCWAGRRAPSTATTCCSTCTAAAIPRPAAASSTWAATATRRWTS